MRPARKRLVLMLLAGLAFQVGAANSASAQAQTTQTDATSGPTQETDGTAASPAATTAPVQSAAPGSVAPDPVAGQKATYVVPAGTKVLLQLRSALNTKSAKPGDGVYLVSSFPVVVGNRVMIPSGVYVQGVVDRVERAGHVKGRAQLDMHFTSIIFPNGSVVEIPGLVNSLPGASKQSVKDDGEGTIEQSPDKGRNAAKTAEIAIPTGGTVGSIGGAESGHPLAGGLVGIGSRRGRGGHRVDLHARSGREHRKRNASGNGAAETVDSGREESC